MLHGHVLGTGVRVGVPGVVVAVGVEVTATGVEVAVGVGVAVGPLATVTVTPADGTSRLPLSSTARLLIVTDPGIAGVHA
jgi:hypothetical protein